MKELSIEQKAKAYDEALKVLHKYDGVNIMFSQSLKEEMFPELKESEEEGILKGLICMCKTLGKTEWIAWLEKQGEQKAVGWHREDEQNLNICLGYIPDEFLRRWLKDIIHAKYERPSWSEEDELHIKKLESLVKHVWVIAEHENDKDTIHKMSDLSFFLKTLKPQLKQEWSEEDKMQLDAAIHLVSSTGHIETANWLKSIKDRVLQQNITVTDEELAKAKKDAYNDALDKIEYHSGEPTFDDGWSAAIWYLKKKNARPQSSWKPSDEQLNSLYDVLNPCDGFDKELLESLYNDLKKLTE